MSSHFKEGTDKKAEEGKKMTIQRGQASSSFQWQI